MDYRTFMIECINLVRRKVERDRRIHTKFVYPLKMCRHVEMFVMHMQKGFRTTDLGQVNGHMDFDITFGSPGQ